VTFSTGIGAITGLILHLLDPGDHLVVSDVSYAGTAEFAHGFLRAKGIEVSIADMSDLEDVQAAVRPNTRLIHAETPCNPVLKLVDLRGLSELAHVAGARVVVDSTFATPAVTRPLEHDVDFVAYSLTKYMAGHGDALGGAIVGTSRRDRCATQPRWRASGSSAAARTSQSRHSLASSRYPAETSARSVIVASRSQQ
jgi:cystathionine gamma-synthase/methionine-gamma-lyase